MTDAAPSSGIASVMLSIDGNLPVFATVSGGTWSYSASGLAEGSHTVSVVATDNSGNQSSPDNFALIVDSVTPNLIVTNPTLTGGFGYSNTSSPTIAGTVTDAAPSSGIASVMLTIGANSPVAANVSGSSWSYNASGLADGNHTVSVVATDKAGNSTTRNFTLVVDTVNPTLTVTTPTINSGVAITDTNTPTFAGTVGDASPSSGIASVKLSIDGGPAAAATLSGGNWTYSGATIPNGDHSVVVTATDKAGNAASVSFTLHVDNTLPKISIPGTPLTYKALSSPITLAAGATVTDPGASNFNGGKLTVSITANADPNDRLTLLNQGLAPGKIGVFGGYVYFGFTVIGTVSGGTGGSPLVVNFTSTTVTPTVAQSVVSNIQFSNTSAYPSTAPRTIEFVISDGRLKSSLPADVTVNVIAPHLAPTVNLNTSGISYNSQSAPVLLAPNATLVAGTQTVFNGGTLTVAFTTNGTAADNLLVLNQGQISVGLGGAVSYGANVIGTISGGTGGSPLVVSLNSNADITATQALIEAIAFQNGSANPSTAPRTVSFQLNDGGGGLSTPATETVNVIVPAISIAPASSSIGYNLGNPPATLLPSATFSDTATSNFSGSQLVVSSDQPGDQLTIQNVGGIQLNSTIITYNSAIIGYLFGNTVYLTTGATQTAIQALLRSYGFSSTGPTGIHNVTFQFSDAFGNTGSAAVAVNVTNPI